jgi:uncharacterized membrane protein YwzB
MLLVFATQLWLDSPCCDQAGISILADHHHHRSLPPNRPCTNTNRNINIRFVSHTSHLLRFAQCQWRLEESCFWPSNGSLAVVLSFKEIELIEYSLGLGFGAFKHKLKASQVSNQTDHPDLEIRQTTTDVMYVGQSLLKRWRYQLIFAKTVTNTVKCVPSNWRILIVCLCIYFWLLSSLPYQWFVHTVPDIHITCCFLVVNILTCWIDCFGLTIHAMSPQ